MNDKFLNEIEKAQAYAFWENETMRETIKKIMAFYIYHSEAIKAGESVKDDKHWVYGTCQNPSDTDEVVGRKVRVKVDALALLEEAFKDIKRFSIKTIDKKDLENPAR